MDSPPPATSPVLSIPHLLAMVLIAVGVRVAIFATVTLGWNVSVENYARKGDGDSYVENSRAMAGLVRRADLDEYHKRVFPGYSALIAPFVRVGLSPAWSALWVGWISAGVVAALCAVLFRDARLGWAMVFLIPHYLINSSLAMSESPMLAFALAGMLLARSGRGVAGGALLGAAGLIRPMACFAAAGALMDALAKRRWALAARLAITAAMVFAAGMVAMYFWTRGDPLEGVRVYRDSPGAYNGRLFLWPGESLLMTPFRESVPWWQIPYVWIHVVIVFSGCALALLAWLRRRKRDEFTALTTPWLLGNTCFQLCIGSGWGFNHFPRFSIPSQPALFFTLRHWFPSSAWAWVVIGIACSGIAVVGVLGS